MVELKDKEKQKTGGLAGVIAADSAICLCGAKDQSLLYRGYAIEDLAAHATYEEVAWLLLRGKLPTEKELKDYKTKLNHLRELPLPLKTILEKIPPNAHMMDVLRTGCSAMGTFLPENHPKDKFAVADQLIASLPSMLLYWLYYHTTGKPLNLHFQETSLATIILEVIHEKKPTELQQRCLDVSLILYAEHEFNASTFTVRTIASTLSDFYSAICGGIGALRGPLHGGANEWSMTLIEQYKSPDEAEEGIKQMLEKKQLVMGFGHRVYTTVDPRSAIIKQWAKKLAEEIGDQRLFPIAERIEKVMWQEKRLFPNLDFYSALAYRFCGIPIKMFTPLFALSRIAGWSSHLLEQRANNKLIRPLSNYIGPERQAWITLNERKG